MEEEYRKRILEKHNHMMGSAFQGINQFLMPARIDWPTFEFIGSLFEIDENKKLLLLEDI